MTYQYIYLEVKILDHLNSILGAINDFLYSYILIILLVLSGIYFTIKTHFSQIKLFPDAIRSLIDKTDKKKFSSFKALMISTASRVGVGNIAGVATALVTGGPGSLFWMWVMAILGAASALIESVLAQIYKIRKGKEFYGGPSYYIQKALNARWLGITFSILAIICFSYGFNPLQAFNISASMEYCFPEYKSSIYPLIVGVILAILTALAIFGGTDRIGFISSYVVPAMALIYISVGMFVFFKNHSKIPAVLSLVLENAFDFKAIFGGFAGSSLLIGIKRGLFSNEAGMGSSPHAAATADVSHPVKQGMAQVISVFIDTLLICSTTAFMVLLSGIDLKSGLNGTKLVQEAVSTEIGSLGGYFIIFSTFAFAFTTIIGNYCYAESNIFFIKGNNIALNIFRVSCVLAVFWGSQADFALVWNISDILMGFMAIVNIIAMFLLSNIALKTLNDYKKQKKLGKNPCLIAKNINLSNTEIWE
jgi:AGCS family alanine or glycine:cation symporter